MFPCEGGGSGVVGVQFSVHRLLGSAFFVGVRTLLVGIGSVRGVFRVSSVGWFVFHGRMS